MRATTRGRVNRRLVGLVVEGPEVPAARTQLRSAAQAEAGVVTSAVASTRMGGPIALAYVHRAAIDAGTPLEVNASSRRAMVVSLPFDAVTARAARASLAG